MNIIKILFFCITVSLVAADDKDEKHKLAINGAASEVDLHPFDSSRVQFRSINLAWRFDTQKGWQLRFAKDLANLTWYNINEDIAAFRRDTAQGLSTVLGLAPLDVYVVKDIDVEAFSKCYKDDKHFEESDLLRKLQGDKKASVANIVSSLAPQRNFWGNATNEYKAYVIPQLTQFAALIEKQKQEEAQRTLECKKKAEHELKLKQQKVIDDCFATFR